MSLYTAVRHPRAHARRGQDPGKIDDPTGVNERLGAWITARIGSMWTVYICSAITVLWMVLGARQVLGFDPYPYPFLLFLGNVAQLLLIFIILLGQQVLGRAADRRSTHTYEDAQAILVDCEQIQNHLIAQDALLSTSLAERTRERRALTEAAQPITTSAGGGDAGPDDIGPDGAGFNGVGLNGVGVNGVGVNERLAAWLTNKAGTMTAFYAALIFQVGWMIGGQLTGFDSYPYLFLLFLSSQAQLLLMFIVMVGQQVIGRAAEARAAQTYLNAEAVLRACAGLHAHLRAQDVAMRHVVEQSRR
jgi:uncharacterized membrane protein